MNTQIQIRLQLISACGINWNYSLQMHSLLPMICPISLKSAIAIVEESKLNEIYDLFSRSNFLVSNKNKRFFSNSNVTNYIQQWQTNIITYSFHPNETLTCLFLPTGNNQEQNKNTYKFTDYTVYTICYA